MKFVMVLTAFMYLLSGCTTAPDLQKEEAAIRRLLQQERTAHMERDAELFISEFADSMISVNRGGVSALSKEEHRKRIGDYFGSVRFILWDNLAEPEIRFSSDATLAYAIIQKRSLLPGRAGETDLQLILRNSPGYLFTENKRESGKWNVMCPPINKATH